MNWNKDVEAAGFTTDNAILHFVNYALTSSEGGILEFDPGYYRANYYDELNPKYGNDWKLYYYDYMCYGKASGKVADDLISSEAEQRYISF